MTDEPSVLRVGEEPPPLDAPTPGGRAPSTTPKGSRHDARATASARFATLNTFVDTQMSTLSGVEVAVWLVLYRDSRDGSASTAQTEIARRVGCDRRSVTRAVKTLTDRGLLEVLYRGGPGRGLSRYRVRGSPDR